jgi:hypothetical protein
MIAGMLQQSQILVGQMLLTTNEGATGKILQILGLPAQLYRILHTPAATNIILTIMMVEGESGNLGEIDG